MKNASLDKYEHTNKEIAKELKNAKREWCNNKSEEVKQQEKQYKSSEMYKKVNEIMGQRYKQITSNCI